MVKKIIKNSKHIFSLQHNSILSGAFVIGLSYLLSAILGLIRNRLLASHFFGGLESHLDVYFAAFVVPDSVFQLIVVGALSAAFIPVLSSYLKKGQKEANNFSNATLNSLLFTVTVLLIIIFIFAVPVSRFIANFTPRQTLLMARLMRIMLVSQIFFTISSFFTGIIQTHRRFLIPAIAPLFYNVGIIAGILILAPKYGIYGPAIGVLVGSFMHMIIQFPLGFSLGYKYKPFLNFKHHGVKKIGRLMLPRSASLAVTQFERWVSVNIVSLLSAGSLAIFNFARQLYTMPITLFGVSLGQASFPTLSDQSSKKDYKSFRSTLNQSLLQIFFFSLPASALLLTLRIPIVRLAFGAKAFPWQATLTTGRALAFFALSIAPQATTHILVRAFYALQNTKTPLIISTITLIIASALGYSLAIPLNIGVPGLALAITVANLVSAFLLFHLLQKEIGSLHIYKPLGKMIIVSFATAVFLWAPMRLLDQLVFDTTRTLPLLALTFTASVFGMAVYLGLSYLLRIEQLQSFVKLIKRLDSWRNVLSQTEEIIESPNSQDQL